MQISLVQGLLLALVAFICTFDQCMEAFFWFRPLVVAFFAGIVLGDIQLGLQVGAIAELSYVGLLTIGGTVPPDPLMAGLMTVVIAYSANISAETALGLALPFALLAQWWGIICNTTFSAFMAPADKRCQNADIKGLGIILFGSTLIKMSGSSLIVFLSAYAMQTPITNLVNSFPAWFIHGFEIAGNLLPAVGLALLLRVMLRTDNIAYLFIGFILATFLNLGNVLPIAILACCLAFIGYQLDKKIAEIKNHSSLGGENNDGI